MENIPTCQIRIYRRNKAALTQVKAMLAIKWGRQATYADAINYLVNLVPSNWTDPDEKIQNDHS